MDDAVVAALDGDAQPTGEDVVERQCQLLLSRPGHLDLEVLQLGMEPAEEPPLGAQGEQLIGLRAVA